MLKIAFYLAAIVALTSGIEAPSSPAAAFVQAYRGDSRPQSELLIKADWARTKSLRQARFNGGFCRGYRDKASCLGATPGNNVVGTCKWQGKVGIINVHPGYCYPREH